MDPVPHHGPALCGGRSCRFRVWAPEASSVSVHVLQPFERMHPLEARERGYWEAIVEGTGPGARYCFQIDGSRERPDPASRFQPEGVHAASEVADPRFEWRDAAWGGLALDRYVLYEVHVGAFTPEGTFDAIIPHLEYLRDLGVTALELMPVAQFPGARNWGYDGVYPFAVQNSYGGPAGLRRLVDAAHRIGLAVALDVVYNHLGPEGNYLRDFGPYFTERYHTPWGAALNFDGAGSDEVRRYFIENALYWLSEFHIDALRLDAVHAILDHSAYPFLEELGEAVHAFSQRAGRLCHAIPESDLNDTRLVRTREQGGFALDAVWNDGFHHSLRVLLTGERNGYYADYGELSQLEKAYTEGFVYSGEYSAFRRRRHGRSSKAIPAERFVVFSQNHDQVGNRMLGERLAALAPFEKLKLAAGAVVLSPFVPLLFMGEEYGERAPFLYFVDHSDSDLVEAVRRGRKEEFASFAWQGEPPDPQAVETFARSTLRHELRRQGRHAALLAFYVELLRLRRETPALACLDKERMTTAVYEEERLLVVRRWVEEQGPELLFALCFADAPVCREFPAPAGRWRRLLDSSAAQWLGPGETSPAEMESREKIMLRLNPHTVTLYQMER